MPPRVATLLVADEIFYNLQGKGVLQGIYPGDLFIPSDPTPAPQLIFFLIAETDIAEPFRSLKVEILFPGWTAPFTMPVPFQWPVTFPPSERKRIFVRWPVLIPAPLLRPGRIEVKLIHESGEIVLAAPWINMTPPLVPPPKTN